MFCLSCSKSDSSPSWGQEVPLDDIRKVQSEALSELNPQKIQKGEFAYFIKTQELFSSQTPSSLLIEEEAITVTEREDFTDYFSITTIRETIDHTIEGSPHYKFKDVYEIEKMVKQNSITPYADENTLPDEPKISFHNLKKESIQLPRPDKVIEREPCPQNQNCDIRATRIVYDIVIQEPGKEAQKNQAELVLSSEVPFFAGILKSCITTIAVVDDARPFVRQCKSIYDYQWTSSTTEDVP